MKKKTIMPMILFIFVLILPFTLAQVNLTLNLSVYYTFDNNSLLDSVGIRNLNKSGSVATTTQGLINGAFSFTDNNSWIESNGSVDNFSYLGIPFFGNLTEGFTINYWFNQTGKDGSGSHHFSPNTNNNLFINPKNVMRVYVDGALQLTGTTTLSSAMNDFMMVTVRWNQTDDNFSLYINNVREDFITQPNASWINRQNWDYFGGLGTVDETEAVIDEFGFWERPLTDEEIEELYNEGVGCRPFSGTCPDLFTLISPEENETVYYDGLIVLNTSYKDDALECMINNSLWISNSSDCYQNHPNASTTCGGLNTGSYSNIINDSYIYMNYTKPDSSNSESLWTVKIGTLGIQNYTIPGQCWDAYPDRLMFRLYSSTDQFNSTASCYNTSAWITIAMDNISDSNTTQQTNTCTNEPFDSDWDSYCVYTEGGTKNWNSDNLTGNFSRAYLYEEAMYWRFVRDRFHFIANNSQLENQVYYLNITCNDHMGNTTNLNFWFDPIVDTNVTINAYNNEVEFISTALITVTNITSFSKLATYNYELNSLEYYNVTIVDIEGKYDSVNQIIYINQSEFNFTLNMKNITLTFTSPVNLTVGFAPTDSDKPNKTLYSGISVFEVNLDQYPYEDEYFSYILSGIEYYNYHDGAIKISFNDDNQFYEFINYGEYAINETLYVRTESDFKRNISVRIVDSAQQVVKKNMIVRLYYYNKSNNDTVLVSQRLSDASGYAHFLYWDDAVETDNFVITVVDEVYSCQTFDIVDTWIDWYVSQHTTQLYCGEKNKEINVFNRTMIFVTPSRFLEDETDITTIVVGNKRADNIYLKTGTEILETSNTGELLFEFSPTDYLSMPNSDDFNISVHVNMQLVETIEFEYHGNSTKYSITDLINLTTEEKYYTSLIIFILIIILSGMISYQTSPNEIGDWVFAISSLVLLYFNWAFVFVSVFIFIPLIWNSIKNIIETHDKLKIIIPILFIMIIVNIVTHATTNENIGRSWFSDDAASLIGMEIDHYSKNSMVEKPSSLTLVTDTFTNIWKSMTTMLRILFVLLLPGITVFVNTNYSNVGLLIASKLAGIFLLVINIMCIWMVVEVIRRK